MKTANSLKNTNAEQTKSINEEPTGSFSSQDIQKLQKLRAKTILDLALLIPRSYECNFLSSVLEANEIAVIDVEVISVKASFKLMSANCFIHSLNRYINAVFFYPKKWQKDILSEKKRLFLRGKISPDLKQIIHPKPLAKIDEIVPIYKKSSIKNYTIIELTQKYITTKNLMQEGLDEKTAKKIANLHSPKTMPKMHEYTYALKFTEIFAHLRLLRSKKTVFPSSMQIKANAQNFIKNLSFSLTKDQEKIIAQITQDLAQKTQKRRVVIGDVGSGKTTIMLATAFMVGKNKSIIMAPTSILAQQLYSQAKHYLDLNIAFVGAKSKQDLSDFDLLIGTHALLYRDLPKVGALMVDEQHRFGTRQRNLLSKLTSNANASPHYFQFSATPIPRTQALIQSTLVDVSFLKTMPFEKKITTRLVFNDGLQSIIEHIKKEVTKDHQTAIIYPLVEEGSSKPYGSLEANEGYWHKNFDGVFVTHGKDKNKEQILQDFAASGKILLATTIVEVGINLPKLTTLVIVGAENLGLASLHQLRGRLSRTGLKSDCFLFTRTKNAQSIERLEKFSTINDGFEIARLDLEYRKGGDIVGGEEQSGRHFEFFDMANDEDIAIDAQNRLR